MGQKQSNKIEQDQDYTSLLSRYQILEKLKTPKYEGTLLSSLEDGSTYLLKETTKTDQRAFSNQISIYKKRSLLSPSSLLSLAGFTTQTTPQLCSTFYKMYVMLEFPKQTLCDIIIEHRAKHQNIQQQLLISIAASVIESLQKLDEIGESHQDIELASIFIDKNSQVKVIDPSLFAASTSYSYAMAGIHEYAGISNSIYLSPELLEQLKQHVTIPKHDPIKSDIFSLGMCLLSLMNLGDMAVYDYENCKIFWEKVESKIANAIRNYSMEFVELVKQMIKKNSDQRLGLIKAKIMVQEQIRANKQKNNLSVPNKSNETNQFFKQEQENIQESPELIEKSNESSQKSQKEQPVNQTLKYEEINSLLLKYGIPPISAHTITQDVLQDPVENEQINNFLVNESVQNEIDENNQKQCTMRQLQFEKNSIYTQSQKLDDSQHSVSINPISNATTLDTLPKELKLQIQKEMEEQIRIQVEKQMKIFNQEYQKELKKLINGKLPQTQSEVGVYSNIGDNFADSFSQKENLYQKCITFEESNRKIQTNNQYSKPELNFQNSYQSHKIQPLSNLELNSVQTPVLSKYSSNYSKQSSYQQCFEYVQEDLLHGAHYEGQKLNGLRHGKGTYQYQDGGMYDGEWFQNKMQGKGVLYYAQGKPAYDGDWVDDKFEGFGILYNEMALQLNGSFDYNDMEKIEEYWIKYEGSFRQLLILFFINYFSDDTKEGMGTLYITNGDKFYGQFKNDCIMGSGVYYKQSGQQIKGIWQNNQLVSIL